MELTEVTGYTEKTHEAVYYRSVPKRRGTPYTLYTMVGELNDLGMKEVLAVTDRGQLSCDPVPAFVVMKVPFVMDMAVSRSPVSEILLNRIEYTRLGCPVNLKYDRTLKKYCGQFDVSGYQVELPEEKMITVDDLKVNVYLDIEDRLPSLQKLYDKIRDEEEEIERSLQAGILPEKIESVNIFLAYHKLVYDQEENKIHAVRLDEKITAEESRCGYTASIMYKADLKAEEAYELLQARKDWTVQRFSDCDCEDSEEYGDDDDGKLFVEFCGEVLGSRLREAWKNTCLKLKYESPLVVMDEMNTIKYISRLETMAPFTYEQVEICQCLGIEPPMACIPESMRKNMEYFKENGPET